MSEAGTAEATPQTEEKKPLRVASWEDLFPTEFRVRAGWGNGFELEFYLRMLSPEEERTYYKRFVDFADKPEAGELEYATLVEGLANYSTRMPVIIDHNQEGSPQFPIAATGSIPETIQSKLERRTAGSERLVHQLMSRYRNRLAPDVSFL